MRSAFDFGNFRRSSVGFDRMFDLLEGAPGNGAVENYPPFDLMRIDDNHYRIELAVAGFQLSDLEIGAQQNLLTVRGERNDPTGLDYVHRGIANRSFERRFALADHIEVRGADLKDGLLSIDLVREIPETMKPRRIEIGKPQNRPDAGSPAEATPALEREKQDA